MMLQLGRTRENLEVVMRASASFGNGVRVRKARGLLSVWYYRCRSDGKHDENGEWCDRIRGIVRDGGKNHIVDIYSTDRMECSGDKCGEAAVMPCSHAVAVLMHVTQDTTFDPVPKIIAEDLPTYMADYTKEDEIADQQSSDAEFAHSYQPDAQIIEMLRTDLTEEFVDPDENRKWIIELLEKDFGTLLRYTPDSMGDLRRTVTMKTDPRTRSLMRVGRRGKKLKAIGYAMEFDISMAYLQRGVMIYADSSRRRCSHVRMLVDMWSEADRIYAKKCCRQALVEIVTCDEKWRDDATKVFKKMTSKYGREVALLGADVLGAKSQSVEQWMHVKKSGRGA